MALAAKDSGIKPDDLRAHASARHLRIEPRHGHLLHHGRWRPTFFPAIYFKVEKTGEFPNLSEARRREARLAMLAKVPESQMLVFGSAKLAHTVTVFTDIDCALVPEAALPGR